ncbi:Uu.00g135220.m01.CDS01 [Anthostomella pinea]|uniref:Uu.00g135220.m01.CDS01 n=1 Tax=Anthostomella pinea TaxID=933095 RepID=A0AAI8VP49_9PEZI|nr:Uu.00g135220.m01.CDS01 [Anthostomella pinea]
MSSTLLPFLYQTRTILRVSPRAPTSLARSLHATCRLRAGNDIPFATDVPGEDIPIEGEETTPSETTGTTGRGTITPSERQVFARIFADIKARGLKPTLQEGVAEPSPVAARSAMLIMQQAAHDAGQSRPATVTAPGLLAGAARDRNKALLRFPAGLRAAARKALDTIEHQAPAMHPHEAKTREEDGLADEGWEEPAHTFGRSLEVEAKRYPERNRIEGLITGAQTDFELWDILEKEVFIMPARLGIAKSVSTPDQEQAETLSKRQLKKQSKKKPKKVKAAIHDDAADASGIAEASETIAESDDTDPSKLNFYIHGPLYPAYLLLALRRLDTAFHASSPFVFSILPRIKELGLESYVLGVSTPFYNELLEIYWNRRGDLSGMLDLLEEMRHCGLYFDAQTASILNQVDLSVHELAGAKSPSQFGRAIMEMPEYEQAQRARIRHWHRAVDMSIKQRQDDVGY